MTSSVGSTRRRLFSSILSFSPRRTAAPRLHGRRGRRSMPQPTHSRYPGTGLGIRHDSECLPSAVVGLCVPHITARFQASEHGTLIEEIELSSNSKAA